MSIASGRGERERQIPFTVDLHKYTYNEIEESTIKDEDY
jgi:hypothetical protein